jgi:hypothetical protein
MECRWSCGDTPSIPVGVAELPHRRGHRRHLYAERLRGVDALRGHACDGRLQIPQLRGMQGWKGSTRTMRRRSDCRCCQRRATAPFGLLLSDYLQSRPVDVGSQLFVTIGLHGASARNVNVLFALDKTTGRCD